MNEIETQYHVALRLLAAKWTDAAYAFDNNPNRWDKAETLRQCASDLARVIADMSAQKDAPPVPHP